MSIYGKNVQSKEIKRKLQWKTNGNQGKAEHLQVNNGRSRILNEPLGIDGRRINVRTSNTYVSNIFDVSKGKVVAGLEKKMGERRERRDVDKSFRKVGRISDILAKGNGGYGKVWKQAIEEVGNKTERQSPIEKFRGITNEVNQELEEVKGKKVVRAVTPSPPRALSPCSCLSLEISSRSTLDIDTLKDQLKGYQIVSMVSPYSLITGQLSNSASVTLKTSDFNIQPLITKLEANGLNVNKKFETVGRKNLDAFGIERAYSSNILRTNSRSSTRHHLETSDDLFGSSPGVGRFMPRSKTPDKQALIINSWNAIRKPPQEKFISGAFSPGPNYMKSTESWSSKSKLIIPHF